METIGAGGGNRTHTALRPPDFESGASASSATPARSCNFSSLAYLPQLSRLGSKGQITQQLGSDLPSCRKGIGHNWKMSHEGAIGRPLPRSGAPESASRSISARYRGGS